MAVGGQYTVQLRAILDTKGVLAQIAQIQKQAGKIMIGGTGATKGASGIAAVGKEANRTAAGVRRLNAAVDTTGKSVKKIEGKKLAGAYTGVSKGAKQATSNIKAFGSTTLDVTKKVIQFGAVTAAIRGVTTGMGAMVQQTFELDSALTEFKKVSDLSGKGLEKYTKQAYEAGKATAKTGVEMVDAATQFKKMGYDDQTSLQLAKHATMFQNIADAEISAGDAAKFINSQMKAYQGEFKSLGSEGEKAAKVIDTVNEVANKNAVGTNDLQLALTKTSAAMGGFGNSFDQVVGIMTAGTEIMVGMPSQVARGWRTIGANILQIAQSSDEYVAASGKVKIATRDQNGEMKNTYAMMKDLYTGIDGVSVAWNDLSKEEQSAIALQLGGKNNMEKFRAVMDNFKTAIKATEEAQKAQGSATRENARYLDSLEGRLQAVKSAWSRFSNAMVQSDDVKKALSGLAGVLEFLASDFGQGMIKAGMAVGSFVGAVKLLNAIRGAEAFSNIVTGAGNVARSLGISTKAAGKFKRALGGISSGGLLTLAAVAGTIGYGMYQAWKSTHKYRNEVKELSKANEENIQKIDASANSAQFYADKIEELSKVENKTNAEKERMAAYVERLNELMPGLNLEYNKETDALNKSTDAIRKYIEAKREEAKIKAYQKNFEKSLQKQVELEEKRADAIKEMERAQKQYDNAVQSGNLDKLTQDNYNKAKGALKDITLAYTEASKEVAKQNNNMLKASGDWKTMANEAKSAGLEITESLQAGLDAGTYLIPETVEGLESLISFDKIANKLNLNSVGKSLVDALQQGMREGNIDVDNALRIADQMQDLQSVMGKEGRSAVEELADQFTRGEIDFTTLQNGIKNALAGIDTVELSSLQESMSEAGKSASDVADRIREISNANPDAKITLNGVEIAEDQVSTVLDYLDKVDSKDPKATIDVNGEEVAVKDIKSVDDLIAKLTKGKAEIQLDANGKPVKKKTKEATKEVKKYSKQKGKATLDANDKPAKKKTKSATKDVKKYGKTKGKAKLDADSSGAEKGTQEATQAVETFSGKEAIAYLKEHGAEAVRSEVTATGETVLTMPDGKTVTITETGAKQGEKNVGSLGKSIGKVKGKSVSVSASTSGKSGVTSLKSAIDSVKGKSVTVTVNYQSTGTKPPKHAKGTRSALAGLAEVNEEGWEFIRDARTGQLRIAGGGKRTTTLLNKGDTVYTHAESKRMVSDKENVYVPQFASGTNKYKQAEERLKKAQEAYNKKYDAILTRFNNRVEWAENQKNIKHLGDAWLAGKKKAYQASAEKELEKLNKAYSKKSYQTSKKGKAKKVSRKSVKKSFGAGGALSSIKYETSEALAESAHDAAVKGIESYMDWNMTNKVKSKAIKNLKKQRKDKKISAEEYTDYLKEIKQANVEYNMSLYEKGSISYGKMLKVLQGAYKKGKGYTKEYYEALEEMREKEAEKASQYIENSYINAKGYKKVKAYLQSLLKAGKITSAQYKELFKELAQKNIDYQMNLYESNRKSFDAMKKLLNAYYKAGTISAQEYYEALDQMREHEKEKASEYIENSYISAKNYQNVKGYLQKLKKDGKITAQQYTELFKQLPNKNIEHQMELYGVNKRTYASMKKILLDYYKAGIISAEEYYSKLKDLEQQQLDKEKERLNKRKEYTDNKYSLGRMYVEKQIALLEKENQEQETQNELIEKQANLEKARTQRVKVYRQGVGFVYEQDTEAVKEATNALREYKKEQDSPELKAWKEVLNLFDDIEKKADMQHMENLLGIDADSAFGEYGTRISAWTSWIKGNRAYSYGYEDLLKELESLRYFTDIEKYLGEDGLIDDSQITDAVNKNRFASGTLSAPAGLARVAESGYEIALLSKGDAVMPHSVSENLMAWGAHSPVEYASAMANTTSNVYHFDSLVLPNVTDANSLLNELNNLPNRALQYSKSRA